MVRKINLLLILSVWLLSCKEGRNNTLNHDIVIGNILTVSVPSQMKFVEGNGIDSYVAYIIGTRADSLVLQYGNRGIINNLYYVLPPVFPLSQRESVVKNTGKEPLADEVLFSEYPEEDKGQNIYDKNFFLYDTINGIIVKIVQPKKIGNGITGLYIPKLKNGKAFSVYGENLDSLAHLNALKIFRSIRYK